VTQPDLKLEQIANSVLNVLDVKASISKKEIKAKMEASAVRVSAADLQEALSCLLDTGMIAKKNDGKYFLAEF